MIYDNVSSSQTKYPLYIFCLYLVGVNRGRLRAVVVGEGHNTVPSEVAVIHQNAL
jgi:hypothetical protein